MEYLYNKFEGSLISVAMYEGVAQEGPRKIVEADSVDMQRIHAPYSNA